jgi:transcriptional regulator with XRE-family HTH domain
VLTGSTIKRLREAKGLTQQQLAVASGLHVSTVSRAENDKFPLKLESLAVIARALGMPPDRLLAEARKDAEKAAAAAGAPS